MFRKKEKKDIPNKTLKQCYIEKMWYLALSLIVGVVLIYFMYFLADGSLNPLVLSIAAPLALLVITGLTAQYSLRNRTVNLFGTPVSVLKTTENMYFQTGTYVQAKIQKFRFTIPAEWKVYITIIWLFLAGSPISILGIFTWGWIWGDAPVSALIIGFGISIMVLFPMIIFYISAVNIAICILPRKYKGCFVTKDNKNYFWVSEYFAGEVTASQ
jgi:hypothetical protein